MSPDTCCRACGAELQTIKACKICGGEKLRGCTRCSTMLDSSNNAIMHAKCASA